MNSLLTKIAFKVQRAQLRSTELAWLTIHVVVVSEVLYLINLVEDMRKVLGHWCEVDFFVQKIKSTPVNVLVHLAQVFDVNFCVTNVIGWGKLGEAAGALVVGVLVELVVDAVLELLDGDESSYGGVRGARKAGAVQDTGVVEDRHADVGEAGEHALI